MVAASAGWPRGLARRLQLSHPQKVVSGGSDFQQLLEFPQSDHSAASQTSNRLEPTETFLHFFPTLLTEAIAIALQSLLHPLAGCDLGPLHGAHLLRITRWCARHRSVWFDIAVLQVLEELTGIVALVHAHGLRLKAMTLL